MTAFQTPEDAATETLTLRRLVGERTMLVLAARPGDESAACGGLIAEACARGRPPWVAVLTDGASLGRPELSADERAALHERETRQAVRALGLPDGRLLMLGVRDEAAPAAGPFFEQIVAAVGFLTWMRDLNVICAPQPDDAQPIRRCAGRIAAAVAHRTGIGLLGYGAGEPLAASHEAAKTRALAAHVTLGTPADMSVERFTAWHGD